MTKSMTRSETRKMISRGIACEHEFDAATQICARCEWTSDAIEFLRKEVGDVVVQRIVETAHAREILMEFLPGFIGAAGSASLEFKREERGYRVIATMGPGTKHAKSGEATGHLYEAIDRAMREAM